MHSVPADTTRVAPASKRMRWVLYGLFIVLIVLGVLMKRVFEQPEWLPPCHIAALFVLIGISMQAEKREPIESDESEEEDPRWNEV